MRQLCVLLSRLLAAGCPTDLIIVVWQVDYARRSAREVRRCPSLRTRSFLAIVNTLASARRPSSMRPVPQGCRREGLRHFARSLRLFRRFGFRDERGQGV